MFAALIEKLVRHEDLSADEAAAAMREVMEGRAASVRDGIRMAAGAIDSGAAADTLAQMIRSSAAEVVA